MNNNYYNDYGLIELDDELSVCHRLRNTAVYVSHFNTGRSFVIPNTYTGKNIIPVDFTLD